MKFVCFLFLFAFAVAAFAAFTTQPPGTRAKWFQWTTQPARRAPDAEARDFIRRAGITAPAETTAVANLVRDLKKAGVWRKLHAFYPFVGGSAETCSHNLVSARYQITWNGGVQFDGGIRSDGTTGYGNTGFNPKTAGVAPDSFHLYVWTTTSGPTPGGNALGLTTGTYSSTLAVSKSGHISSDINSNTGGGVLTPQTFGNVLAQRVNDPLPDGGFDPHVLTYSEVSGTFHETSYPTSLNPQVPDGNLFVLARNDNGTPIGFPTHILRAAAFGQTLKESEVRAYFAAVTKFQTALNRAGNP